jgi:D-aminopeptidase
MNEFCMTPWGPMMGTSSLMIATDILSHRNVSPKKAMQLAEGLVAEYEKMKLKVEQKRQKVRDAADKAVESDKELKKLKKQLEITTKKRDEAYTAVCEPAEEEKKEAKRKIHYELKDSVYRLERQVDERNNAIRKAVLDKSGLRD